MSNVFPFLWENFKASLLFIAAVAGILLVGVAFVGGPFVLLLGPAILAVDFNPWWALLYFPSLTLFGVLVKHT